MIRSYRTVAELALALRAELETDGAKTIGMTRNGYGRSLWLAVTIGGARPEVRHYRIERHGPYRWATAGYSVVPSAIMEAARAKA